MHFETQTECRACRALAVHPKALLLDEPLSALDAKIRVQLRDDIRAIQQELGITTIYVTHDQEEAMSISDEIAVMRNGKIEQVGTPFEIYNNPATSYVASFIGTLNLLEGTVVDASRGIVDVNGTMIRTASAIKAENGAKVKLTVRPEALSVVQSAGTESAAVDSAAAEPAGPTQAATPTPTAGAALSAVNGVNVLQGSVDTVKFLGATIRFVLKFGETFMYMDRFNDPQLILPKKGDILTVAFPVDACKLLP